MLDAAASANANRTKTGCLQKVTLLPQNWVGRNEDGVTAISLIIIVFFDSCVQRLIKFPARRNASIRTDRNFRTFAILVLLIKQQRARDITQQAPRDHIGDEVLALLNATKSRGPGDCVEPGRIVIPRKRGNERKSPPPYG